MIYKSEKNILLLLINLFKDSTSVENPNNMSFWNTSATQENQVG